MGRELKLYRLLFLTLFLLGCQKNALNGLFDDISDEETPVEPETGFKLVTTEVVSSFSVTPAKISTKDISLEDGKIILQSPQAAAIDGANANFNLDLDTWTIDKMTWGSVIGSSSSSSFYYNSVADIAVNVLSGGSNGDTLMYIYDYNTKTFSNLIPGVSTKSLYYLAMKSDGTKVVYRTPNGLFMVDTSTKAITTLSSNTDDESYGEVKFTPDGQKVVFFRVGLNPTPNNLFVVDIDGSNLTQLSNYTATTLFAGIETYEISPDGSTVVYYGEVNYWPGVKELYRVDIDGSNNLRVHSSLVGTSKDIMGDIYIAPDSSYFVFSGDITTDTVNEVYAADIDGSNMRRLNPTSNANRDANVSTEDISISSDSTLIYFTGDFTVDGRADWYSSTPDGATVVNLTNFPAAGTSIQNRILTSDESTLISVRSVSGEVRLFTTNLGTRVSTDITGSLVSGGDVRTSSAWDYTFLSPDETQVYFAGDLVVDGQNDLYKVPIGGGSRTTLRSGTAGLKHVITNDGTRIISIENECVSVLSSNGTGLIDYANLATNETVHKCTYLPTKDKVLLIKDLVSGARQMTIHNIDGSVHKEISAPLSKSYTRLSLQISDDKTKMAYLVDGHIYVAGMDGSNPIKVSQYPLSSWSIWSVFSITLTDPSDMYKFSPDGQHIAYIGIDLSTGISNLHTVRVDGSSHNTLTTQTIYEQINGFKFSPDGTKIAILDEEGNPEVNGGRLIFVSDIDGSNQVQIAQDYTDSTRYISHYTEKDPYHFTSDSQYIIYISRGDWCCSGAVSMENVYANKVDGSDYREIGNAANNSSEILILSASNTALYAQGGVLNTVDVTTGTKTPLSTVCKPGSAVEIQSRGEIACENGGEIFLVKLDGSTHSSVHTEEALYSSYTSTPIPFKLSSDEKYIVYAAFLAASTQQYKIFSYNLDTGVNKTLSPTLKVGSFQFEYIPNQQSIIYSGLDWNENKGILRKINLDGTGEVIIESSLGDVILTDQFHFSHTENYVIYPVINTPFDGVRVKISTYDTSVQEFLNEGDPVVFYNFYSEDHILLGSESGDDSDAHYVLKRTTIGDPTPEP